jgi:hydrogenase maturation protease
MNSALLEKIVNAVLYEGYILYPYRASSKKNRQRFTFGRVYPKEYSVAQKDQEPCSMQTEILVRPRSADCAVNISVRFLHPMSREVGVLKEPISEMPATGEPAFHLVNEQLIGEKLCQTWQESVERMVELPTLIVSEAAPKSTKLEFSSSRELEPIRDGEKVAALFVRRQQELRGVVETSVTQIDDQVFKVTVRILNRTPVPATELQDQDAIVMRTFASTHTVLQVQGGEFISLLEPPPEYAEAAAACQNVNTWPVLVGEASKNERDVMLSSPIILYDYPQIAPESAGDLFDGAEIDEILTLRIMTMTDEEKREMRGVDDHARKILERTEMLPDDHLLKMHGAMRGIPASSSNDEFFNPTKRLESAIVAGVELRAGDKVRIWPKKRADIMDMALEGKVATIEALEEDLEKQVHFALVIDDDPGRDMGLLRQSGHRFFYSADEVEPIREMTKPE